MYSGKMQKLELSIAIRVKVEVTLSNWNFGFQLTFLLFTLIIDFEKSNYLPFIAIYTNYNIIMQVPETF